jgi:hypothetical protein
MTDAVISCEKFGIQARNQSSLVLENVAVSGCEAVGLCLSNWVSATVTKSRFSDCQIGAQIQDIGAVRLRNCEFTKNRRAGAVFAGEVGGKISGCKFSENEGIGAQISGLRCGPLFANCNFDGNSVNLVVTERADPSFIDCTVHKAEKFGVSVVGASVAMSKVTVTECGTAGIGLFSGARGLFQGCQIKENPDIGCQVQSATAVAKFVSSNFTKHTMNAALVICDGAHVTCDRCGFRESCFAGCEVVRNAVLEMENCAVSGTRHGVGVQVHLGGKATLTGTKLSNHSEFGLCVGVEGACELSRSELLNCTFGGAFVGVGGGSQFAHCTFMGNGNIGAQIEGSAAFRGCHFTDHASAGIFTTSGANLQESDSTFVNNGERVYRS